MDHFWLDAIMELQSIAQIGLTYSKDVYDSERYTRLRELSALMLSRLSDEPIEKVRKVFCCEKGYQTPKLDCRAAILQDEKILLVQENNGLWSLPGGWCDIGLSLAENTVKEAFEEAGVKVEPVSLIALQDRNKHNLPRYAYSVAKGFVLCRYVSGGFLENSETVCSGWFDLSHIPEMDDTKNTLEQVKLCFAAYHAGDDWKTQFD